MTNFDTTDRPERQEGDELFSVPVKAGKRIYYFDVKSTRNNDYYITVTESRKRQLRDGSFAIDKHKIHLYKEDFEKFADGLQEVIAYIRENKPEESADDQMALLDITQDDLTSGLIQTIPSEEEFFAGL